MRRATTLGGSICGFRAVIGAVCKQRHQILRMVSRKGSFTSKTILGQGGRRVVDRLLLAVELHTLR